LDKFVDYINESKKRLKAEMNPSKKKLNDVADRIIKSHRFLKQGRLTPKK
ncbi:unnamed protein product, partial [marine sediment metagenome]